MDYFTDIQREQEGEQDFNFSYIPEIKVVYTPNIPLSKRPRIHSTEQAVKVLFNRYDQDTIQLFESFKVILMNPSNRVLGVYSVTQGAIHKVSVNPRLLFGSALKAGATAMIISHCHPTEDASPSKNDLQATKAIKRVAALLGITLLDHIILSVEAHYSFRENNLL